MGECAISKKRMNQTKKYLMGKRFQGFDQTEAAIIEKDENRRRLGAEMDPIQR